jgi:hypothetical protein
MARSVDSRRRGSAASQILSDSARSGSASNFIKAVVVDVVNDPALVANPGSSPFNGIDIKNRQYAQIAPRNSLVVKLVGGGRSQQDDQSLICFPFFPPHLSLPANAGELVWVMTDNPGNESSIYYWMCRVSEPLFVDDINYTHSDRRFTADRARNTLERFESATKTEEQEKLDTRPGFPNGGGTQDTATLNGGETAFDTLVARSSGYAQTVKEAVPRYTKRPGDTVLQGSNNATIALTTERPATGLRELAQNSSAVESGVQNSRQQSGAIDMVVGRGQSPNTAALSVTNTRNYLETQKTKPKGGLEELNPQEGDPDWVNDAARFYAGMRCDGDTKFGISQYAGSTDTSPVDNAPFCIVKSDNIRLSARSGGTIRITKEGSTDSLATLQIEPDGTVIIDGPRIVIGDGRTGQTEIGDGATEAVILGDLFMDAFNQFLTELSVAIGNLGIPLTPINAAAKALSARIAAGEFRSKVAKVK